jgi:hypothetical protein
MGNAMYGIPLMPIVTLANVNGSHVNDTFAGDDNLELPVECLGYASWHSGEDNLKKLYS